MNKKAMSQVIAVLLIVLLSLIAVTTVWGVFKSITERTQLAPEFECTQLSANMPIRITDACYNPLTQDAEITLSRKLDTLDIKKINFIIGSNTWCCGLPECSQCQILETGEKIYYFDYETSPSSVALMIDKCFIEEKEIKMC